MKYLQFMTYSFQLSQQVETLNDKITCSNADLKADIERWHKTKRKDFRRIFMAMADRQIQYYQKVCVSIHVCMYMCVCVCVCVYIKVVTSITSFQSG